MTVSPDAPVPPAGPSWRHPALGGLILLVAANALLPLLYGRHAWAMAVDHLSVLGLSFWTAVLAHRRARREGPAAFRLLGLGAALGGFLYLPTLFRIPHAALAGPALSILALLALGLGFLFWPQRMRMPRDRVRTTLDGLAIALSVFTAAWVLLGPQAWVGRLPRAMVILYLVQISTVMGVLALWLLQETRLGLPAQARAKGFVRGALLFLLAHSALAALLRVTGRYHPGYLGHGVEVLHQVATLFIALAALSPDTPPHPQPTRATPSPFRALIPSLVSLAVLLLAAGHFLHHGESSRTLALLCLALLGIIGLRHGLLILDLERLSHGLEARIEARTRELEAHHHEAMGDLRMRMMAGLAAGLAHDLNNILGVIRLRVELLQETSAPRQQADLKVLAEATERAAVMTRRILAASRLQDILPAAFDFSAWLASREALLRAQLGPRQGLVLQVAEDLQVLADPQSLDQILQNLVANARDAMGPEGCLRVQARREGESIRLEVRDDGPGIPPEHLARMFEPFFTTKAHGTGLGLATVRNLVLQNRGTIHIDSAPGRGTAFRIDLPAPEPLLLA